MPPKILFAISMHGFGHLGQSTPVIEALHAAAPDIEIVIASSANKALLQHFLRCPFRAVRAEQDVGMVMHGPLDVDAAQSFERYHRWHHDYRRHERRMLDVLDHLQPALVVSNVGYTVLSAAARRHIPAIAFSSLNWADILQPYCREVPGMEALYAHMIEAYNSASLFMQVTPHMAMPGLQHVTSIGPVARGGSYRREELCRHFGLAPETRIVLFSLGGIPLETAPAHWSVPSGSHWIVPDQLPCNERHCSPLSATGMPYLDVLASADVLVTKPGYGSFAEAACRGGSVIFVERGDWPEEPALVSWLLANARAVRIERRAFEAGQFRAAFAQLDELPTTHPVTPRGVVQAASLILDRLRAS